MLQLCVYFDSLLSPCRNKATTTPYTLCTSRSPPCLPPLAALCAPPGLHEERSCGGAEQETVTQKTPSRFEYK